MAPAAPAAETLSWRAATRFLRSPLRPLADALSCTLYPADCLLCSQPLLRASAAPVCSSCLGRLHPQSAILCHRCGDDLGVASFSTGDLRPPSDRLCQPCRLVAPAFARAFAFGVYENELRELIHLLKYGGLTPLARPLGERLAGLVAGMAELPCELLVIPVPLHKSKYRQRGFNHAGLIARSMLKQMHRQAPGRRLTLASGVMERTRSTESQASLTPRQRRQNLRGAFTVTAPDRFAGRDVLLVDDIYTTGATARAASRVLLGAGAASVWVATVARAQRQGVAQWDAHPTLGQATSSHPVRAAQHKLRSQPSNQHASHWEQRGAECRW